MTVLVYGVDFGTSMSAVMVGTADGRIIPVANPDAAAQEDPFQIPSSVLLHPQRGLLVGTMAERLKGGFPDRYRTEFKRDLGNGVPKRLAGSSYTTGSLVTELLRYLRTLAEAQAPGRPELVVLTVPFSWAPGRHREMMELAGQAGFDTDRLLIEKEPFAAAVRARVGVRDEERRLILVYDLGGGTFDCALLYAGPEGYDQLDGDGSPDIGGSRFDRCLADLVRERHPDVCPPELVAHDHVTLRRQIDFRDGCVTIKHALSDEQRYPGDTPLFEEVGGTRPLTKVSVSRPEFEAGISALVGETMRVCEALLHRNGFTWSDVDEIVPVGGSSRVPLVTRRLREASGRRVRPLTDPGLAVVHGATLIALDALLRPSARDRRTPRRRYVEERVLSSPQLIESIRFQPGGRHVAAACSDWTVRVWETATGRPTHRFGHGAWVTDIAFHPGGDAVASLGLNGDLCVWDLQTRQQRLRQNVTSRRESSRRLTYSPDGSMIGVMSGDQLVVLDLPGGDVLHRWDLWSSGAFAFAPDQGAVACAARHTIDLRDPNTGRIRARRDLPRGSDLVDVAYSPQGDLLAVACARTGTVFVLTASSLEPVHSLPHTAVSIHERLSVAFSSNGKEIATGGGFDIRLWDASDGRPTHDPLSFPDRILDVDFNLNGLDLAVVEGGNCHLFRVPPAHRPPEEP